MASAVKRLTLKEIAIGSTYRLIDAGNGVGYGYKTGESIVVTYKSGGSITVQDVNRQKGQINVSLSQITHNVLSKEDIEKRIEELTEEVETNQALLDWMKTTKSEVYDETEFKVWNTLKVLNSKSTDIEKARVIAKLITG